MYQSYYNILSKSQLFKGIEADSMNHLLKCMTPVIKTYDKNEVAAVEGTRLKGIGIVLDGHLNISKTGITGNRIMLGAVGQGDLFGETAAFSGERVWPATVESQNASRVMYILSGSIIEQCSNSCSWHRQLQKNMLGILAGKAINLTKRIEYMAIKGLRTKICTYLYNQYMKADKNTFLLPMKKYELAEFFNVARPSLSREMIRLKDEGTIDFKGAQIKITDLEKLEEIIAGYD